MIASPRILILEDNPHDRQLLEDTLRSGGSPFEFVHARDRAEFQSALEKNVFDLVISDFGMPAYNGTAALALSKQLQPETPFIFVSGTIGEERAVESLKLGATDYVVKDRLGRLNEAVSRALREARERREHDRDAERRKQLEEQLHQAQKMEAVGQLAGGIAHDFNNLLLVIHGNTELVLQTEKQLSDQSREFLKQVTAVAERATHLIRQLLAFSRKEVIQFQPFNLNQVIGNLTKMVKRIIGEDIHLQCQFADNLPSVRADVGLTEQVLLNLFVNARDAMPAGGSIFINTEALDIDEPTIEKHPGARAGKFICVTVRDTGAGIPPENLPRIFEPFFTTKPAGKGTGLGLATAYNIVQQHGGWIDVASAVGKGTAFKIFLPANVSREMNDAASRPKGNSAGKRERILLVEDDGDVRSLIRTALQRANYQVHEAASSIEALELCKEKTVKFDLLLTDVVIPGGTSGKQLAEQMQTEQPQLKVIFMSGYHPDSAKMEPHRYFLQKPCPISVLTGVVRECLDENP
jgi:two-component system, cell cycle sensor histidine kinase and response regulator CckA